MGENVLPMRRNVLWLLGAQGSWGKGRKGQLILHSCAMVRIWAWQRAWLDQSPAASSISYMKVNGVSRESHIHTDQGRALKDRISPSCSDKGHFLWDVIFILNFRMRLFPCLPTSLWPWELGYSQRHNRRACSWHQVSWTVVGKQESVPCR